MSEDGWKVCVEARLHHSMKLNKLPSPIGRRVGINQRSGRRAGLEQVVKDGEHAFGSS